MKSTRIFYLFTFLSALSVGVTLTIYVPLMIEDLHFSYADVALVNVVFWATVILAEIPTGAIADGRGRGWSVMWGAVIMTSSSFIFAVSKTVGWFMLAESLAGISRAFYSGALTSWIADAPDRDAPLSKVYGTATMIKGVTYVVGPFVAMLVVSSAGRWSAFVIATIVNLIAVVFAYSFMRGNEIEHTISEFEALQHAWSDLKASAALRWVTVIQFATGLFVIFNLYWTPFLLARVTQLDLAYAWVFMYGSLTLAGWVIHRATPAKGLEGRALLAGLALTALPFLVVQIFQPLGIIVSLFLVHEFGRGALQPLTTLFIDRRVKPAYRATFQSLSSFAASAGSVVTLVSLAVILPGSTPESSLIETIWLIGGLVLSGAVVLLWLTRPEYKKIA